jgi:hypothetical protein
MLKLMKSMQAACEPVQQTGVQVEVGSNSNVYGGVDWVAMGMSADTSGNLTDPEVGM